MMINNIIEVINILSIYVIGFVYIRFIEIKVIEFMKNSGEFL